MAQNSLHNRNKTAKWWEEFVEWLHSNMTVAGSMTNDFPGRQSKGKLRWHSQDWHSHCHWKDVQSAGLEHWLSQGDEFDLAIQILTDQAKLYL